MARTVETDEPTRHRPPVRGVVGGDRGRADPYVDRAVRLPANHEYSLVIAFHHDVPQSAHPGDGTDLGVSTW